MSPPPKISYWILPLENLVPAGATPCSQSICVIQDETDTPPLVSVSTAMERNKI